MANNKPLGWTMLEEAKKLVKAGFDPNTADMYFVHNKFDEYILRIREYDDEHDSDFDVLFYNYHR